MKTTGIRHLLMVTAIFAGLNAFANAKIQIIHNSPDAATEKVDIWVNGSLFLDDFAFRTATPFIDAPSGDAVSVTIYPSNSNSTENPLWSGTYTIEAGRNYVMVANGLINQQAYMPFKPFEIYVYDMGQVKPSGGGYTDILVFHGSTDTPMVDIKEIGEGAGEIVADASYGMFAGYLQLPTMDYILEITDALGPKVLATFRAPLKTLGLENTALVAVASGFLNSAANSNGPGFGIWVALPSGGDLIELPVFEAGEARVQIIHNSPDVTTEEVDVYLNGDLFLENFTFRTATPFVSVPAGIKLNISIFESKSNAPVKAVYSNDFVLDDGMTYVIIASGMADTDEFGSQASFALNVYDMGREKSNMAGYTDVLVFHGAPDAPVVDVVETGLNAGTIVDDLAYGEFEGYLELPVNDYILDIRDASGITSVGKWAAPLAGLGLENSALVTVASGFLNNSYGKDKSFGLWVALPSGGNLVELPGVNNGNARVQVIHNSADMAAEVVDVWLNDTKLIENFAFRTATPFIDAPAGILLNIGIAPPNSASWTESFKIKQVTLTANETYVVVANGIVSTSGYNPSPIFVLNVYPIGRESASQAGNTDILVVHGSTDAPTVDICETGVGAGQIVNNLMYGNVAGYLELPTDNYVIEIRDETGTTTVAAYQAPLAALGLEGTALSVLASGFLNPDQNSNGPAFGLYVALTAGGDLIELPLYEPTARLQVIHNSADAAAAVVDVWANDVKLLDNFAFRSATPFIDVPAETPITISITGPGSTSPKPNVFEADVTFATNETYVVVANGMVSASGYEPNEPFNLYIYDMGRESASDMDNTDVLVFHGSTDAPVVDVYEIGAGAGMIIDDMAYGDFRGYLELPTADYILNIRDASGTTSVVSYSAPLETLDLSGSALVTVASGFLNPSANSNGEAFGLWVALPQGGDLVELPVFTQGIARVQVIHNSADLAAETVDVWLNDALLLDNFTFRTASPFIDAPAGVNLTISIKDQNSTSPENPIWTNDYLLADGETYILVANGIVSATGYDPVQPFDIYVYGMGREAASGMNNTDVLVFHGSTDAPVVDVVETGVGAGTIVDDMGYGEYFGYLELPNADYKLAVRDQSGTTTVATYSAPLNSLDLAGQSITVMASGFLTPGNNSNGEEFGLWVSLASGGELIPLSISLGVNDRTVTIDDFNVYPNPAGNFINVNYTLNENAEIILEVIDLLGKTVISRTEGQTAEISNTVSLDLGGLKNGMYFVNLRTADEVIVKKFQIAR
ncbi:MAG: DUF4397 domain-containing protein [Bacteroidales bacterium]|nr:DUF4397 domain-containing protein [Bacteroidales bacterium]